MVGYSMKSSTSVLAAEHTYGPAHSVQHPEGGRVWLRPARLDELQDLHALIASEISPDVGPTSIMRAVFLKNPISFWRIERQLPAGNVVPVGMYAFLPLNNQGVEALKAETFNTREPQLEYVAAADEQPAGLYIWAVVARKIRRLVYPLITQALGPTYTSVPVFAIPETKGGVAAVVDRGFVPVAGGKNAKGELALLPTRKPDAEDTKPAFDVIVASTSEHLQMSAFIRGATFGAEQACPYFEEFDGNDFCAMHLIGTVDGEPAATIRIRYFASFAKLERLAVLERFRKTELKNLMMRRSLEICARKGYAKVYGQSQERLVGFYAGFGFRPMQKNRRLIFSDHAYVEIERDLAPGADSITVDSDPYHIIRPEGAWDIPGVLERSAARPATNPGV
jgi:predicted GNAT family N-acyltransferase